MINISILLTNVNILLTNFFLFGLFYFFILCFVLLTILVLKAPEYIENDDGSMYPALGRKSTGKS
jgi:hypothetical protein